MISIKREIAAFIVEHGVPAACYDLVALAFAKAMQKELEETLAGWKAEIDAIERRERDRPRPRIHRK